MAYQQTPPASGNGKLIGGIIAIVIAIICVIIATGVSPNANNSNVSVDPNAAVTCDGQTMSTGDTCVHSVSSSTYGSGSYNDDYEQQALYQQSEKQKTIAEIVGGAGIIIGLYGLIAIAQSRRNRRSARRL